MASCRRRPPATTGRPWPPGGSPRHRVVERAVDGSSLAPHAPQARDAARQEQRDENEQQAEHEQPVFRAALCVNQLLPRLTTAAPSTGPIERAAAAHRGPDRDLDRVGRRHLARIDDADLRHVQRTGDAADDRGQRPDEQLEVAAGCSRRTSRASRRRGSPSARGRASSARSQRPSSRMPSSVDGGDHEQRHPRCRRGDRENPGSA